MQGVERASVELQFLFCVCTGSDYGCVWTLQEEATPLYFSQAQMEAAGSVSRTFATEQVGSIVTKSL